MNATEWEEFDEYRVRFVMTAAPPPWELVQRVGAVCFWHGQIIVIKEYNDTAWNLPGGRPEPYETHQEQVLHREVMEEACARIGRFRQLGYREVDNFERANLPAHYVQPYYWCEISELLPWLPEMEVESRQLVDPADFLEVCNWGKSREKCTRVMLEQALNYRMSEENDA